MSEKGWATIIYGRSYHLDFRFITIPDDFTERDTEWALEHILATTQQARNLTNHPRWSLFKNDSHCVAGITCMVRDLSPHSSTDPRGAIDKDNQGRPLYTFVGYVTKLDGDRELQNFPAYTREDLDRFQTLCREIIKVWWVKNYERDSIQPSKSQYQPLEFSELTIFDASELPPLNDRSKSPDRTYLSPSSDWHNNLLWLSSAQCIEPTSTCLNIRGKALVNSPFLNQTINGLAGFQVKQRVKTMADRERQSLTSTQTSLSSENSSELHSTFSQKISHRAKEDLDLTLQQAAKVAIAGQELINNFADWSNPTMTTQNNSESEESDIQTDEVESFGFKTKRSSSSSKERDWF